MGRQSAAWLKRQRQATLHYYYYPTTTTDAAATATTTITTTTTSTTIAAAAALSAGVDDYVSRQSLLSTALFIHPAADTCPFEKHEKTWRQARVTHSYLSRRFGRKTQLIALPGFHIFSGTAPFE